MNLNNYTEYKEPFYRIEMEDCIDDKLVNEVNIIINKMNKKKPIIVEKDLILINVNLYPQKC